MKKLNSFIMSHVKLVNLILSILYLALFVVMFFAVKYFNDHGHGVGLIDYFSRWIKYTIYHSFPFSESLLFILLSLGLVGNVLFLLYLFISTLINKKNNSLLFHLAFLSIIIVVMVFIQGITLTCIPFLIMAPILIILMITLLFINIKYSR